MYNYIRNKKGFLALLGLILAVAIIFLICYKLFNVYFQKTPGTSTRQIEDPSSVGTYNQDTGNYIGILGDAKRKIQNIDNTLKERYK